MMASERRTAPADSHVAAQPIRKAHTTDQVGKHVATTIVASGHVAKADGTTISDLNYDDGLADMTAYSSVVDAAAHEGITELNVPEQIQADIPNEFLLDALSNDDTDLDLYAHNEHLQEYSDSGSEYDPEADTSLSVVKTSKDQGQTSPTTFKKNLAIGVGDVVESTAAHSGVATHASKIPVARVRGGRIAKPGAPGPGEVLKCPVQGCGQVFRGKNPRQGLWHHVKYYATTGRPDRVQFEKAHSAMHAQMLRDAGKSYSHTRSNRDRVPSTNVLR
jgi:hypothetical protein